MNFDLVGTKMAAIPIHTSWSSCCYSLHHLHFQSQLSSSKITIKSQESPSSSSTTPPPEPPSSNKPTTPTGLGFGSFSSTPTATSKGKKQKSSGRAVIRRRDPVGKSALGLVQEERKASSSDNNQQQLQNEGAFVLTWLGLGGVILAQGILLAASGLLPEEWDKFLVKFLYPSFTPTVGLFVAGSVAYGVTKYLQNENLKD